MILAASTPEQASADCPIMLATNLLVVTPSLLFLTVTLSDIGPLGAVVFPLEVKLEPPIEQTIDELEATSQFEEFGNPATVTEFAKLAPEIVTLAPEQPGKLAGVTLEIVGGE